jgi:hypothetical protein
VATLTAVLAVVALVWGRRAQDENSVTASSSGTETRGKFKLEVIGQSKSRVARPRIRKGEGMGAQHRIGLKTCPAGPMLRGWG